MSFIKNFRQKRDEMTLEHDEKRQINQVAIFAVAALVIASAIGTVAYGSYKTTVNNNAIEGYLDSEEGKKAVEQAFLEALSDYSEGGVTEDELRKSISSLIANYMESSNGFTTGQIEALNSVISSYLDNTTIYKDIEKNTEAIDSISKVIEQQYQSNYDQMTLVQSQLAQLIAANTSTDDTRYAELVKVDENIRNWINDASRTAHTELNEEKANLNSIIDALDNLFNKTVGGTDWASGQSYAKGDAVFYEGNMYVSLHDGNTNDVTNQGSWVKTDILTIIDDLSKSTDERIEELTLKMSSNLDDVNSNLTDIIENNAALSAEKRQELLDLINSNQDLSEASMTELNNALTAAIENEASLSSAERAKLQNQLALLTQSTATDIANTKEELSNTIIDLDNKYSVYYEQAFSRGIDLSAGACNVTINSESIKKHSDITIVYDSSCKDSFTVDYEQNDGSLVLTVRSIQGVSAPSAISGTIYINNSMDNATKQE